MADVDRILIIDGGIGGLTLATALHQHGFTGGPHRAQLVMAPSRGWTCRAAKRVEHAGAVIRHWGFCDQQGELLCNPDHVAPRQSPLPEMGAAYRRMGACEIAKVHLTLQSLRP